MAIDPMTGMPANSTSTPFIFEAMEMLPSPFTTAFINAQRYANTMMKGGLYDYSNLGSSKRDLRRARRAGKMGSFIDDAVQAAPGESKMFAFSKGGTGKTPFFRQSVRTNLNPRAFHRLGSISQLTGESSLGYYTPFQGIPAIMNKLAFNKKGDPRAFFAKNFGLEKGDVAYSGGVLGRIQTMNNIYNLDMKIAKGGRGAQVAAAQKEQLMANIRRVQNLTNPTTISTAATAPGAATASATTSAASASASTAGASTGASATSTASARATAATNSVATRARPTLDLTSRAAPNISTSVKPGVTITEQHIKMANLATNAGTPGEAQAARNLLLKQTGMTAEEILAAGKGPVASAAGGGRAASAATTRATPTGPPALGSGAPRALPSGAPTATGPSIPRPTAGPPPAAGAAAAAAAGDDALETVSSKMTRGKISNAITKYYAGVLDPRLMTAGQKSAVKTVMEGLGKTSDDFLKMFQYGNKKLFAGGAKMFGVAAQSAMAGGSKVAAAKVAAMGGARMLGAAMPGINVIMYGQLMYDITKGLGKIAVRGVNLAKDAMKSMQGTINKPMFGTGFVDNEVAASSRARGVMAIQNSRLNARSLLGSEAAMMAAHFG